MSSSLTWPAAAHCEPPFTAWWHHKEAGGYDDDDDDEGDEDDDDDDEEEEEEEEENEWTGVMLMRMNESMWDWCDIAAMC